MGKTLKHIIQGIVLGASLLSIGCNGKDISNQNVNNSNNQTTVVSTQQNNTSSGIEKIINKIIPKQEKFFHEEPTQEQKEYLKAKYGNDGGVRELYKKIADKGYALYGIDPTTGLEYYYNIEPYTGNIRTEIGETYSLYVVLPDKNNEKTLVRLSNKIISYQSEFIDQNEEYDSIASCGYLVKEMASGIFCMKENGQFNGNYGFRELYADGKDTELDINVFSAKIVKFPDLTEFATIVKFSDSTDGAEGTMIDKYSNILGDVDPKVLKILSPHIN